MSDHDEEEEYDFENAEFVDSEYMNSNYVDTENEEMMARVYRIIEKREKEDKEKALAIEAKRRTINERELEFCTNNELVFIVIPYGNIFNRFFISKKLFPSSYFFGTNHNESLYVVPDETIGYDMNTAYMLFPTKSERYHKEIPIDEAEKIIYPSREEERDKKRVERNMKRKERAVKRRERDAKREERKENLKRMRAEPGDEEYLRLVREKYALLDIQDELLDKEDLMLNNQDNDQDNIDNSLVCTICKSADAQVRCKYMNCVNVFCEACYNMTKFNDGNNAECRVCRRNL